MDTMQEKQYLWSWSGRTATTARTRPTSPAASLPAKTVEETLRLMR
jgi:hypothetical protein